MNKNLINILACPDCLSQLALEISECQENEIISGILRCSKCNNNYPIMDKIPRLLRDVSKKCGTEDKINKHREIRDANIHYHDIAADTYEKDDATAEFLNHFNQKRIEEIIEEISIRDQNLFLDVGCGTGNILKFGSKYFNQAVGIDVSVNMLKLAQKKGFQVIQADSLFLPFRDNSFSAVSIFSVLHHVYDYTAVLSQIGRVLRKNGTLYSDWDPNKTPTIDQGKIGYMLYRLLLSLYRNVSSLNKKLLGKKLAHANRFNLRELEPSLKNVYKIAEYHNEKPNNERGLDFDAIKQSLLSNGFTGINPTFHWTGKPLLQLRIKTQIILRVKSLLANIPTKRFMENIQIIARKN